MNGVTEQEKKCSKCGEVKPLSGFYKDKGQCSGYKPSCKNCESIRIKEYQSRPDVKERQKEYSKKYLNRPDVKEMREEYRKKHTPSPGAKNRAKQRARKELISHIRSLSDTYLKILIRNQSSGMIGYSEVPANLIELKRQNIILKRLIKDMSNE